MKREKVDHPREAYRDSTNFNVLASFIAACACLDVLENLIREGATPVNVARQTGLMRIAVTNARDELQHRGISVPDVSLTACAREI